MTIMAMLLMACVVYGKDIKTLVLTTTPQMQCASCEEKIKGNLRFEKGVKSIETSIAEQSVTIQYDAEKTNEETLIKAFDKFGYKAVKKTAEKKETVAAEHKDCAKKDCDKAAEHKDCAKKDCNKAAEHKDCAKKDCNKAAEHKDCAKKDCDKAAEHKDCAKKDCDKAAEHKDCDKK